jgi:beta-galactosidase/beta-glucuronidase
MKKALIFATILILLVSCEYEEGKIRNLKGSWKFTIGDNKEWADPGFNDSKWDRLYAPARWERNNYYNYNGYAWYRKSFRISQKYKNSNLYLILGIIDDVDEVYVNGRLVGASGSFPPDYESAVNSYRKYHLPADILNFNKDNVIAVRVYDNYGDGGIVRGNLGIYATSLISLDINLRGEWKFDTGDSIIWKDPAYSDSDWISITVPGIWEDQGYDNYDGYAWYRKSFDLPPRLKSEKLVLLMGKIDDIDQVYLNGTLVGSTGEFNPVNGEIRTNNEYRELRGYYILDNVILKEKNNLIAVRVYDAHGVGGIYEGPVGVITQENYTRYWLYKMKKKRIFPFEE